MDTLQPVVIDNGSSTIKAGYAGGELPKVNLPNYIANSKYPPLLPSTVTNKGEFVGQQASHLRGVSTLTRPVRRGIVNDWRSMSSLWAHATRSLGATDGQHPILLTESALTPVSQRVAAHEVWFEGLRAPAVSVQEEGLLALFATGRTTGLSVTVGEGTTTATAVYEGYLLRHATARANLGGCDVTARLARLLCGQGVWLTTGAEMEIARELKESVCFTAPSHEAAHTRTLASSSTAAPVEEATYTLPDGVVVRMSSERTSAMEVLFAPEACGEGMEGGGLAHTVGECIDKADRDLRAALLGDVVLSGGCTLTPGFGQRAAKEIRGQAAEQCKVRVWAAQDRAVAAWVGGSILASMSSFNDIAVKRSEWEEMGASAVYRKTV